MCSDRGFVNTETTGTDGSESKQRVSKVCQELLRLPLLSYIANSISEVRLNVKVFMKSAITGRVNIDFIETGLGEGDGVVWFVVSFQLSTGPSLPVSLDR